VHRTLIRCYFSPALSSGSHYVYSGSADGKVKIYNIDSTVACEIDVHKATEAIRPSSEDRLSRRPYSWWGGFQRDFTCVRDVSWHPSAPVFAATSFQGGGIGKGTVSVHTWRGADWGLEDDEKEAYKPRIYSDEMEPLTAARFDTVDFY
jgi:WD repeat-containing protein 23